MSDITEHHTKEEWESDHVEGGWVHFSIVGNTVSCTDFMEWISELIQLEVSWWG
jgi:hypothetical protein